jgi:uncharacterized protein with PIN domain
MTSTPVRECPLCGELMRLVDRTIVTRVPGTPEQKTSQFQEWVCPECDYFEEKEDETGSQTTG